MRNEGRGWIHKYEIGGGGLFVVDVGVLLLAYVAVRFAPGTEMVGLGPRGESAVVGGVFAIA